MEYKRYIQPSSVKIRDLLEDDRPREKLLDKGRQGLTKCELLAIVISSGTQEMSALGLAHMMLKAYDNSLYKLSQASIEELTQFKGIGKAKATKLVSALELARRSGEEKLPDRPCICSPEEAYDVMKGELMGKVIEEFWVLLLNRKNYLLKKYQVSRGGISRTIADPRVIFKAAMTHNAASVILLHNHPSGNPSPSASDKKMTEKMVKASDFLDIPILDHIIFSDFGYYSFADHGLIFERRR